MEHSDLRLYEDNKLIEIFVRGPDTPQGRAAKEILEYRKYKALKWQNSLMVILTVVISLATLVQVFCECGHLIGL